MGESRLKYIVCDGLRGCASVMISLGGGKFQKKEGFRTRKEAEIWVERQLRQARLKSLENELFSKPWLQQRMC